MKILRLLPLVLFSTQLIAQQATAERTLLNGLRVQILATQNFPKAAIHLRIGAGTTLDPVGKAGLAELATALMLESVADWQGDPEEISRIIEAGKTIRYEVDWDATRFSATFDPAQLDIYMQAFSRLVRNPVMSEKYLPAIRDRSLKRFESMKAGEVEIASSVFDAELFRGNPYARLMQGTSESLKNITYGDVVLFQRRYHLPNVSHLSLVGNVNADQVKTLAGRNMGIWIMDDAFPYTFAPPRGVNGKQLIALDYPGGVQPAVIVGALGVERTHRDFLAQNLLVRILAGRGSGASNFQVKVDQRRLRGALRITLQKKDLDLGATLNEVIQALTALRENGPTAEETARAAQQHLVEIQERIGTVLGLAETLAEAAAYQLGFNYYERLKQELPSITAADLKLAAQRLFDPANLLAVFLGQIGSQNVESIKAAGWQVRTVTIRDTAPAPGPGAPPGKPGGTR